MGYLDVLVESDVLQEVLYEKGGSERHSFSQPELQVWRLVDSAPQLLPSIRDQLPYRAYRHPAKSPTAVSASSLLTAINLIMIRTSILRRLRLSHPAKIVLAFLGLALFLLLPSYRPSPTFDIDQLDKATASELESQENTEISARQEAISGSGCCSAHTSSAHPSDRRGHFRPGCGDICQATSTFH